MIKTGITATTYAYSAHVLHPFHALWVFILEEEKSPALLARGLFAALYPQSI